jgi:hypothetical protein
MRMSLSRRPHSLSNVRSTTLSVRNVGRGARIAEYAHLGFLLKRIGLQILSLRFLLAAQILMGSWDVVGSLL